MEYFNMQGAKVRLGQIDEEINALVTGRIEASRKIEELRAEKAVIQRLLRAANPAPRGRHAKREGGES
ncbi:MAG: hypothetical protein BWY10_02215 [Chloroflexi bacterium ADurb.Bin180]|nr:MAG: hypothetical protein BWY10_02215 [Chloroflexi bacterium ADurb.Bin180]